MEFRPQISAKSQQLGESILREKLKDFQGSHEDYLIAEAARLKTLKEQRLREKEQEECKGLQDKPDITSLYQSSRTTKLERIDEEPGRRPENKWDWLYKVGVEKVIREKRNPGRRHEDIVLEKDKHEYTFSPSRKMALQGLKSPTNVKRSLTKQLTKPAEKPISRSLT